jgi:hypothetical protein
MYWYLFWVAVLAWTILWSIAMMALIHRSHMKTLELLRLYAEKGVDPPRAMDELLARSTRGAAPKWTRTPRGARLQSFMGMLFTACVAGGILWWRIDAGGPQPVIYIFGAAVVFWGVGALGMLIAALFASDQ